ncbi:MAG: hypothetical protein ACJ77N_00050, partial [Chloroflexota bacterium]
MPALSTRLARSALVTASVLAIAISAAPVAAREATPRAATSRAAASPGTYRGRVVPAQAAKRAAGIRHATR